MALCSANAPLPHAPDLIKVKGGGDKALDLVWEGVDALVGLLAAGTNLHHQVLSRQSYFTLLHTT